MNTTSQIIFVSNTERLLGTTMGDYIIGHAAQIVDEDTNTGMLCCPFTHIFRDRHLCGDDGATHVIIRATSA